MKVFEHDIERFGQRVGLLIGWRGIKKREIKIDGGRV